VITWLTKSPSPAAVMPASEAIFQRYHGPGRSTNHRTIVAAAKTGTAHDETKSPISSSMNG
jgi:hypothetical protein